MNEYTFLIADSTSKEHGTRVGPGDGVGYGRIWMGVDGEKERYIRWYDKDGYKNDYLIEIARPVELMPELMSSPIFDTGPGTYPSIFGTHNGTITPNQTISVHKLYTYPCKGTGGHTEYVKFWNLTWNVTANWNGYRGDWHNVSFNESFTLVKGETYNYTIRTGSYPRIHHTPARPTANGWINCTEFVDANGRVYYDWIPAIRLYF